MATKGAMRAAKAIIDALDSREIPFYDTRGTMKAAEIIDRETGVAELVEAVRSLRQELSDLHGAIAEQGLWDRFIDDSINMFSEGQTAIKKAQAALAKAAGE